MSVRFYDVGQALSALVTLPDGRHVLVDTGESPKRAGCGGPCVAAHAHLMDMLHHDLATQPIDLLWITHQHSDHLGGAPAILESFPVTVYADNGRDLEKNPVERARGAAMARGVRVQVIDPQHGATPLVGKPPVTVTPILPATWPKSCKEDANDCSIALRIEYCASSVLFVGDAEATEEALLSPGKTTLIQVGHHGSDTSSSDAFLAKISPRYAVISSGKPFEGLNTTYCHPRSTTVEKLAKTLGGATDGVVRAFDAALAGASGCKSAGPTAWRDVPVPSALWSTARDGDVTLVTRGDGTFIREP